MSEPKRRRTRPQEKTIAVQKTSKRPPRRGGGALRLALAAGFVAFVVAGSAALTRFLRPAESVALAQAQGAEPTAAPTPSPEPTLSPTPAAFAPFGAQYGYGGEALLPEAEETALPLFSPVPTDTPAPTLEPTPEGYETLRRGAQGDSVRRLQQALIDLGYLDGAADGDFGANTQAAVIQFQAVNGLTADGIAGQRTLTALYGGDAKPASAAPPTDFLLLVNRQHALDANFVPFQLASIESVLSSDVVKVKYAGTQANRQAIEALGEMLRAAEAEGIGSWQVSSAYRTYKEQQRLVDNSVATYQKHHPDWSKKQCLSATYNTVAPAGTSEHQTGLAFDMTVPGVSFTGTKQQIWLHKHCHEYGFVVRYTKEKQKITGFIAESWHIRYVGLEAAAIMTKNGWCLEEYIEAMSGK